MDAAYGIDLGGRKVDHLSFADDLVLLATCDEGLRCLVDAARMKTCGLNINASKRSTSNIVTNAKKKQWACNPAAFFCFADDSPPLPPTTITAAYRYLGIDIGITNGILNTSSDLQARLNYVTKV